MVDVCVQELGEGLVDAVDAGHSGLVLCNHMVAVKRLEAVVRLDVLDVGVLAVAAEEIKVAFFRVLLNHKFLAGLRHVLSRELGLIVSALLDLFNHSDEKARCVLLV